MNDLLRELDALTPDGDRFWARVSSVFDRMEIAEDEIVKARVRHPEHSDRIWGAFKLLCATHLSGYPDVVYRAHCVEILDRVADGVDTRLGTKAEVMVALAQASLVHPPSPVYTTLYAQLFLKIFSDGGNIVHDLITENIWVDIHEALELLDTLRVKAGVDTRVMEN